MTTYFDAFAGIGCASAAFRELGWRCVGRCEIDERKRAVLKARFDDGAPLFSDMTRRGQWRHVEPTRDGFDVLVGGPPCTSFSIAGKMRGLDDDNGALIHAYIDTLDEWRPEWFVFENVPNLLSIDGGGVFDFITAAMEKLGYSLAWRVLDARHFGLPQARRRLFVVGNRSSWRAAAMALFDEPEGPRGREISSAEAWRESVRKLGAYERELNGEHRHVVAFNRRGREGGSRFEGPRDVVSIRASLGGSSCSYLYDGDHLWRMSGDEAELAQGLPAKWTDVAGTPETVRRSMVGDGQAVPVMLWIGRGIEEAMGQADFSDRVVGGSPP